MAAFPAAVTVADTSKPKADPKGKLLQALKLPLSMVPKAADEAEKEKVEIQLGQHESPTSKSSYDSSVTSSPSPKPYTPRLLQRLAILQRRTSVIDDGKESSGTSPQASPQPSLQGTPLPGRPLPSPPTPTLQGSSLTPTSSKDSQSRGHSVLISEQETPQMSPRLSPLTSFTSGHPSLTLTTPPTSPSDSVGQGTSAVESEKSKPGESSGPTRTEASSTTPKAEGTIIKVEGEEPPPPPPPAKKHIITIWQLLARKKYLMKHMTADFELPNEEDLLDRFSVIDLYARRIFPSFFFILFTIYWVLFNYYITDEFPHKPRIPSDGLVN